MFIRMNDRSASLYGLIGGAALSAGIGVAITDVTGLRLLGALLLAALGVYASLGSLYFVPVPFVARKRQQVIDRAQKLGSEMLEWLSVQREAAPQLPTNESEYRGYGSRVAQHGDRVRLRWDERFLARSLAAYDAMVALGAPGGESRFTVEHPTNELGMREVAALLQTMAEALGSGAKSKRRRGA